MRARRTMGHDDFQSEGVGQATRPKRVQYQLGSSWMTLLQSNVHCA